MDKNSIFYDVSCIPLMVIFVYGGVEVGCIVICIVMMICIFRIPVLNPKISRTFLASTKKIQYNINKQYKIK